ncbi:MAG: hypothetical protein KDK39_08435 [Leptospiraceae bacterium]|nr:hypothetical protein [Leptospiraceae bacterium]
MSIFFTACPENSEDALMWRLYQKWHPAIEKAVSGTDIDAEYMAAIISLESHPPGNADSSRFEAAVYRRLQDLRDHGTAFGYISRSHVADLSDAELREYATSHGLTQIMGYHCFRLKCTIEELRSPDHLLWAIAYMQMSYKKAARKHDWESCFRVHNTGRPDGQTTRADYVTRGLQRMQYYHKWIERNGQLL